MAPPLAAAIRRPNLSHLRRLLSSKHLGFFTSYSPSNQSDFEPDPDHPLPLPPSTDGDGELASFVHRISSAVSSASSPKDALTLLSSSRTGPSPAPATLALLLASFVHRISSAVSSASSPKDALTLLSSSRTGPSPAPATPALLVRALWELRHDPDAPALAVRYGDESSHLDEVDGAGAGPQSSPSEAWHLAVWAAGKARRFDLAWAVVRRMRRRGVLTRRAMVILIESSKS
nr:unnamed protein product [Digitaria exilis]